MPPHFPHPHPMPRPGPRPRPRYPVRGYGGPVPYYEPQVISATTVDNSGSELPWRVIQTNSHGTNVLYRSATLNDANTFFKNMKLTPQTVGFNVELALQLWTGLGWKTKASRNSQDPQLGGLPALDGGLFAMGVILVLAMYMSTPHSSHS